MGLSTLAYSRFITSHWYTFWCVTETYNRDDQIFEVCGVHSIIYRELKEKGIESFLINIKEKDPDATTQEIEELKGYIKQFIDDVESDQTINDYEEIKLGDLTNVNRFLESITYPSGIISEKDKQAKKEINEIQKILGMDPDDLPLILSEIETTLGKAILEKRFKNDPI